MQQAEEERIIRVFAIDENLANETKKLEEEGFRLMPGVPPVAVYHLVRMVARAADLGSKAKMVIDESQVFILKADGTIRQ